MSKPIDPWAEMDALMSSTREPIGPEWFTTEAFMRRYNLKHSQSVRRLKQMETEGRVERWKGKLQETQRQGFKWRVIQ